MPQDSVASSKAACIVNQSKKAKKQSTINPLLTSAVFASFLYLIKCRCDTALTGKKIDGRTLLSSLFILLQFLKKIYIYLFISPRTAEQWRRISVLDDGVDISPSRHLRADDIYFTFTASPAVARRIPSALSTGNPIYSRVIFSEPLTQQSTSGFSFSQIFFFKLFAASITSRTTRHALIAPTGDYSHLDKWDYIGKFLAVP